MVTFYYTDAIFDLLLYIILILGLCLILLGLGYIIADHNLYYEKTQGYECGFDPFSDAQDPFNVKFYLISILFLLFDIELIFFLPWLVSLEETGFLGFYIIYFFFIILVIGYFYEWRKNCLNWE
jgi:NADH:ubiquinone oxidoreductase subunit 3 (subunit A)